MHDNKQFAGSMVATWRHACSLAAVMVGVGVALLLGACAIKPQPSPEELQARQAHLDKVQQAKARFEELCKTAGITVNRRVTGVKGIRLEKVPPKSNWKDWADPMWADAALANGLGGDAFIATLVSRRVVDAATGKPDGRVTLSEIDSVPGFDYVDVRQPEGNWRRYSIGVDDHGRKSLMWMPIAGSEVSRYGVSYEGLIDLKDRESWIAGVDIRITDLLHGGQLGVVRKYVWEQGMGDVAGGRSPWLFAHGKRACPNLLEISHEGYFWMAIDQIISREGR